MAQGNVETVRDAFQTFSANGIDAALSCFSPDVVWYTTDRWLDDSAYRGHEGIRSLVAAFPRTSMTSATTSTTSATRKMALLRLST